MRIVFMGTPEFAVESLKALVNNGDDVVAVFTRRDAPKNRGMKLFPPPVKVCAEEFGIPVYQPVSLKNEKWITLLNELKPELIVVAAYGKILPKAILDLPKFGCINVHASVLPKYRGASPINAAILNGEATSGVTIMQMAEGLDTGDMLYKSITPINENETYGQLHDRLAVIGGKALVDTIELIKNGNVNPEKQNDQDSCYAKLITTSDTAVDFYQDANVVSQHIRAYDPQPGAFCRLDDGKVKLFASSVFDSDKEGVPGLVSQATKKGLVIECKKGSILIGEIQVPGGKRMPAAAFYAGHRDFVGKVLSSGVEK